MDLGWNWKETCKKLEIQTFPSSSQDCPYFLPRSFPPKLRKHWQKPEKLASCKKTSETEKKTPTSEQTFGNLICHSQ